MTLHCTKIDSLCFFKKEKISLQVTTQFQNHFLDFTRNWKGSHDVNKQCAGQETTNGETGRR